jgi:hypothetical protein
MGRSQGTNLVAQANVCLALCTLVYGFSKKYASTLCLTLHLSLNLLSLTQVATFRKHSALSPRALGRETIGRGLSEEVMAERPLRGDRSR